MSVISGGEQRERGLVWGVSDSRRLRSAWPRLTNADVSRVPPRVQVRVGSAEARRLAEGEAGTQRRKRGAGRGGGASGAAAPAAGT